MLVVAGGLMSVWNALFGRHWWSARSAKWDRGMDKGKIKEILEELEEGVISADEAAKRMGK